MDSFENDFSNVNEIPYLISMKIYLVQQAVVHVYSKHFDLYKNSNNVYKHNYDYDFLKIYVFS